MEVTRKQFLSIALAATAGTLVSPGAFAASPSLPAQLESSVGQTFEFVGGDRGKGVELVLSQFAKGPASAGTTQFSLLFDAPGGEVLSEGTYAAAARGVGEIAIFIVPAGAAKGHRFYRADFNLLAATSRK